VSGVCCGVPFSSKGYEEAHAIAANRAIDSIWHWSDHGRLPVVVDTSPCAHSLQTCRATLDEVNQARFDRLTIVDSIAFVGGELLPRLSPRRVRRMTALHPVCSVVHMGLVAKLQSIVAACSERVFVPYDTGCCGFAGDRGFQVPELTASATRRQGLEVRSQPCDEFVSSSGMCEVAMTRATGRPYRSFLFLAEEATTDTELRD
jgi:D-lactate dehydrogenase